MEITVWVGEKKATLSTKHSLSSYGQPVLIVDSQAYKPGDEYQPVRQYNMACVTTDALVIAWNKATFAEHPEEHELALQNCIAFGVDPSMKLRQYIG